MSTNNAVTADETRDNVAVLPCRGCTRQCKSFGRCHGKPWRLYDDLKPKLQPGRV